MPCTSTRTPASQITFQQGPSEIVYGNGQLTKDQNRYYDIDASGFPNLDTGA